MNNSIGVRSFCCIAVRSGGLHYSMDEDEVSLCKFPRFHPDILDSRRSRATAVGAGQDVACFVSFSRARPKGKVRV